VEDEKRYLADYVSQGYGEEAAYALTRKRIREQPSQVWKASDIDSERHAAREEAERQRAEREREKQEAEIQRKVREGLMVLCASCDKYAPVRQGVILEHYKSGDYAACHGTGIVVKPL
jgi:hypothetical protein